jgi:hypothetical protein
VHQLVWSQHHLVSDGCSQGQVLRELLGSYAAFRRGARAGAAAGRGGGSVNARSGKSQAGGHLLDEAVVEIENMWSP